MISIALKSTSQLTDDEIFKICRIKDFVWNYGMESQRKWFHENISPNDFHLMIINDGMLIGYLNMIVIKILLNETEKSCFGIGNVCTLHNGHGHGRTLLEYTTNYLSTNQILGLLFCKPILLNFYSKFGWQEIKQDQLASKFCPLSVRVMIFQPKEAESQVFKLDYSGKLF